jgi:hypothetical protein
MGTENKVQKVLEMDMKIVFPGGKKVNAEYKGFSIETDQSVDSRGDGAAPEPFDLFLASIGTCAGIYVLNFPSGPGHSGCRRRTYPIARAGPGNRADRQDNH